MQKKMFYEATPYIFQPAKELRLSPTGAETKLWEFLRGKPYGYKFRRQHPIGPFIADFYCHALKLVIEVDGSIHNLPEVQQLDKAKQYALQSEGLQVIRFTNHEVIGHYEYVIASIQRILPSRKLPLQGVGG